MSPTKGVMSCRIATWGRCSMSLCLLLCAIIMLTTYSTAQDKKFNKRSVDVGFEFGGFRIAANGKKAVAWRSGNSPIRTGRRGSNRFAVVDLEKAEIMGSREVEFEIAFIAIGEKYVVIFERRSPNIHRFLISDLNAEKTAKLGTIVQSGWFDETGSLIPNNATIGTIDPETLEPRIEEPIFRFNSSRSFSNQSMRGKIYPGIATDGYFYFDIKSRKVVAMAQPAPGLGRIEPVRNRGAATESTDDWLHGTVCFRHDANRRFRQPCSQLYLFILLGQKRALLGRCWN